MSDTLARRVAKGALWLIAARWGVRLIGIASTILLARLLRPTDYGLVGMATLLYALVQSAGDFSLDMDLIRSGSRERERYDTVWTLEIVRGLLTAALVVLLAIPAAAILHQPHLIGISAVIAAIAAISGFANVGVVEFRSEFAFARECVYTLAVKLASFVVAVPLAFAWRDYRALVAGLVASAVARVVLSFALHPYRPRLSLARFREVFGFSKWLWFSSQLFFVRTRSDELFVSKFVGIAALGFYRIARTVAELPTTELITPVLAAIFPGFSKLSGAGKTLRRGYLAVLTGGLCLMAPLAFGLMVTADLVLDLGFGRQWSAAVPLLRLLAFTGPLELLVGNAYAVFVAMGRPRLFTYTSLVNAAAFLVLLALLVPTRGAIGAAMALVGASLVGGGLNLILAQRLVELPARDVAEALWRPVTAAASMAAFLGAFRQVVSFAPGASGEALMLAACVALGAAIYTVVLFALWAAGGYAKGAEATIIEFVGTRVRPRFPALMRLAAGRRGGR
ncbi:MAG: oligosaccharide flippase family protein [Alphaproteobacteria bacterium]|nr:oligosaccharide flippase family protein [Alphaproteobacteria bacterium]